jgi:hypothetical protein
MNVTIDMFDGIKFSDNNLGDISSVLDSKEVLVPVDREVTTIKTETFTNYRTETQTYIEQEEVTSIIDVPYEVEHQRTDTIIDYIEVEVQVDNQDNVVYDSTQDLFMFGDVTVSSSSWLDTHTELQLNDVDEFIDMLSEVNTHDYDSILNQSI